MYFLFLLPGMLLALWASLKTKLAFDQYSQVPSERRITGARAAAMLLDYAGVTGVRIEMTSGFLSDHYDPTGRVLRLSESVYSSDSLAAIGVACHEAGHAIQHATNYAPLEMRSAIVPAANIGSSLSWPLFLIGLFAGIRPLVTAGIVLFSLAVLFQLVTLPVEVNASARALKMLQSTGILGADETKGARKVLTAAAMTYVAALAASILQLLRLVILAGGRRDD